VVVQLGTKKVEEDEKKAEEDQGERIEEEEIDEGAGDPETAPAAPAEKKDEKEDDRLVLSGFVRGEDTVDGKPAILDLPVGEGRVILFAFNPLHRYLNHSDFRFVYNVLLHWNDLPE
jgi:hypothetical protein